MKNFILLLVLALGIFPARADTLYWVPDPDSLGGMVMPVVTYKNTGAGTGAVSVALTQNNLPMSPLHDWYLPVAGGGMGYPYASDSFDARDPWYTALDPSQENRAFSTQFGFDANPSSDPLPSGKVLAIRLVSVSTGVVGYMDEANGYDGTGSLSLFQPVFQNVGDTVTWGTLTMWHPVFTASQFGPASATFEVFVADPLGGVDLNHVVDWATGLTAASGYTSDFVTLNWNVVPEPTAFSLLAAVGMLGAALCRRRHP